MPLPTSVKITDPDVSLDRYEKRIDALFREARNLGMDYPSDNMLYDLLRDTEFNTLLDPEKVAREHGLGWKNGKVVIP
jgi:hypothetical protein